ncbi:8859_t:CDS:2 [Diversispora eburnea]|uniref:8859_t:CDS:1 n=1 Tax=Diversispora eburnea TaxID=1213867 RepID=A0A9N9G3Y1_9GLOM|nr:8859_t:CDS:2 [Diversispora eburnea]
MYKTLIVNGGNKNTDDFIKKSQRTFETKVLKEIDDDHYFKPFSERLSIKAFLQQENLNFKDPISNTYVDARGTFETKKTEVVLIHRNVDAEFIKELEYTYQFSGGNIQSNVMEILHRDLHSSNILDKNGYNNFPELFKSQPYSLSLSEDFVEKHYPNSIWSEFNKAEKKRIELVKSKKPFVKNPGY